MALLGLLLPGLLEAPAPAVAAAGPAAALVSDSKVSAAKCNRQMKIEIPTFEFPIQSQKDKLTRFLIHFSLDVDVWHRRISDRNRLLASFTQLTTDRNEDKKASGLTHKLTDERQNDSPFT